MLKGGSLSPDQIQGFLKKSYEKNPSSFNDYQIDKSLSGERVQVYYNPALRQAVVVHRGSQGAKDWLVNDVGLVVGYRGNRFSHAQDIQNKAEKKYGAKNVTTLGHSLGAKVAEEVGQNSKEVITLNKPTVDTKKVSNKQYDIRTTNDLVSGLSGIASSKNKTTISSGFRNPLTEHSTDVLSRLGNKKIGRGSIQPTPAQMLQRLVNRHYVTQQIADLEERHEALFQLWERYTDYAQTLNANDAEQFFDLLEEYGEELADIGEEIDQQQGQLAIQNPANMEGGADMEDEDDEDDYSVATPDPEVSATLQLMINTHDNIIQNQNIDIYDRRDFLEELIETYTTYVGSLRENDPLIDDFNELLDEYTAEYNEAIDLAEEDALEAQAEAEEAQEEEDAEANKENIPPSNIMPRRNPRDPPPPDLSRGLGRLEGSGVGNIFRRVRPDRIYMADNDDATMTNAEDERLDILARDRAAMNMADNEEFNGEDWANLMAHLNFEDVANRDADISEVSYSDPDSDESNPINFLGDYTPSSSDSSSYYELGNTPRPRGGNRMCRCCRRPNCDCYTMSDFNELHSR